MAKCWLVTRSNAEILWNGINIRRIMVANDLVWIGANIHQGSRMSLGQDWAAAPGGRFKPDYTRNDSTGLERYQQSTRDGPDITSAPPGQRELPTIWGYYSHMGEHYDKDLVKDANNTVEVLLIFAGLFSAVVTGFISQTYPMMRPDPSDILTAIYQESRRQNSTTLLDEPFVIPPYAVRVNCFLFAGLFTSMLVAMLGILVKQWTRSYERELAGVSSHHLRARIRHFRYNGAKKWHLASIVGLLSIFMHLALFISAVGIIDLLLSTAPAVGYVALSVFCLGTGFFVFTTLLPLFVHDAPFRSPLSRLLFGLKQKFNRLEYHAVPNFKHFGSHWAKKPNERVDPEQQIELSEGNKNEEALEDHVELSQSRESEENSIVRTQILLDLDIVCYILSEADKSTDRWLLDLCFQKLPQLTLLASTKPDAFLSRKVILEVYMFLAEGCLQRIGDKTEIASERLPRAKQLCKFLAWYLSLRMDQGMRQNVYNMLRRNGGVPEVLPRSLATDPNTESLVAAYSALGSLRHLTRKEQVGSCTLCESDVRRLLKPHPVDSADGSESMKTPKNDITYLLVTVTACLVLTDKSNPTATANLVGDLLTLLTSAIEKSTSADKKPWELILYEREAGVSPDLISAWFTPLKTALRKETRAINASNLGVPPFVFTKSGSNTPLPSSGASTPFFLQRTPPDDLYDGVSELDVTASSNPLIQIIPSDASPP